MQLQLLEFIKSKSGIQTILSTHSPNLASKVPTEKIHLLSKSNAFSLRKGATKLQEDDYSFLNKFLDVTKSNLFFARGVIIVEGDAENILLPTLAKLVGCSLEKYGVSIVNVGHTGLFRFSRIFQRNDDAAGPMPINVACITDRDLRPACARYHEDKDGNKDNPDGYIKETPRNKSSFEDYYDGTSDEKKVETYISDKKKNDGKNVCTFVSLKWTLEYDLALLGLGKEMYEAINGSTDGFDKIDSSNVEKFAAYIYRPLETNSTKSKAETAFQLGKILERDYWDEKEKKPKKEALLPKLPEYLVQALEFVTKTSITKAPETEVKDV
jgi:putative ATP-dependent endonuclease of OLD family